MKTLADIPNLKGVKVFLRADFNVPVKNGVVTDDFRIRAALPTIEFLKLRGARVVITSHIEVAEGEKATLEPVAGVLEKLGVPVRFVKEYRKAFAASEDLVDGQCMLLENLRTWEGEKQNDPAFAEELASLADIYVNDAFSVSHRVHASIVGVPKLIPGYVGAQVQKEIEHLSKAFNPSHPFLFILGGAKFATKMPLIEKFSGIADTIYIGGAIANDFYKAKGYEVGQSVLSDGDFDVKPLLTNSKIVLPTDVVTQDHTVKPAQGVSATDTILDIGPASADVLASQIRAAKFILWNGTLGYCEKGFTEATTRVAQLIAEVTKGGATSIVGGGDTVAALSEIGLDSSFTFVSTAGGAMLDFLAKGTLPGLEVLK